MAFKGNFIRVIVLSFFVLAITTVGSIQPKQINENELATVKRLTEDVQKIQTDPGLNYAMDLANILISTRGFPYAPPNQKTEIDSQPEVIGAAERKNIESASALTGQAEDNLNNDDVLLPRDLEEENANNSGLHLPPIDQKTETQRVNENGSEQQGSHKQNTEAKPKKPSLLKNITNRCRNILHKKGRNASCNGNKKLNAEQGQVNQGVVFKMCKVMINGEADNKLLLANKDVDIRWNAKDHLAINYKKVELSDNRYDNIKIKYNANGGISVNEEYVEGFEDIMAWGQTDLRVSEMKSVTRSEASWPCCQPCAECEVPGCSIL